MSNFKPNGEKDLVSTVGLHIADVLAMPVADEPLPEHILLVDEMKLTVAGTAAATAIDLAKVGGNVATFGSVGDDALGRYIKAEMQGFGIDVTNLTSTPANTAASMVFVRPDGERVGMHATGASNAVTLDTLNINRILQSKVVHLGGLGLLPGLNGEPGATLLKYAKEAGCITTLDIIPGGPGQQDDILAALKYVDYFFPNETDALYLTGAKDLAEALETLHEYCPHVIGLTLGGDGLLIQRPEGSIFQVRPPQTDVVDTTGCGDALSAGFIFGLANDWDLIECAKFGVACGSLVATGLGSDAGIVDFHQVAQIAGTLSTVEVSQFEGVINV